MTDSRPAVEVASIEGLLRLLDRGLGNFSLYPADNPVYLQTLADLRLAFASLWARVPDLSFSIEEGSLRWEGHPVLESIDGSGNVLRGLFDYGVRTVTLNPGVEYDEIVRFLGVIQRGRILTDDDDGDLLTLLWDEDFQYIRYTAVESVQEDRERIEKPRPPKQEREPDAVQERIREEAELTSGAPGFVKTDEFDSTLYFLDKTEIEYLEAGIQREYAQDLSVNVLSLLFDTLELQSDPAVRSEVIEVLEEFLPLLLAEGNFQGVAYLVSEAREVMGRAKEVVPAHLQSIKELTLSLSHPEVLAQLFHRLDDDNTRPSVPDLAEFLGHLQPEAFETILRWLRQLTGDEGKKVLSAAVEGVVRANPAALSRALESSERTVLTEALKLVERIGLKAELGRLRKLASHADAGIRVSVVRTLTVIGGPGAFAELVRLMEDSDSEVRVAAIRALVARGYKQAVPHIEEILGKDALKSRDLGEKRAFFDAFGRLSDDGGVDFLKALLVGKGRFARRPTSRPARRSRWETSGPLGRKRSFAPRCRPRTQSYAVRSGEPCRGRTDEPGDTGRRGAVSGRQVGRKGAPTVGRTPALGPL